MLDHPCDFTYTQGTVCVKTENRKDLKNDSPVNYAAKCFKTAPYGHEDSPR